MISFRVKFQNSCIPEESSLHFKWNALTSAISWQHTHSVNWLASFHIFQLHHSCALNLSYWISASSWSLRIWENLFGTHRFNLEVDDFIFHVAIFSRETFQTLAWKLLLCFLQRVYKNPEFEFFLFCSCVVHSCSKFG